MPMLLLKSPTQNQRVANGERLQQSARVWKNMLGDREVAVPLVWVWRDAILQLVSLNELRLEF